MLNIIYSCLGLDFIDKLDLCGIIKILVNYRYKYPSQIIYYL